MKFLFALLIFLSSAFCIAAGRITCHIEAKVKKISARSADQNSKYKGNTILELESVTTNCKFDPAEIKRYSKFSTDDENLKVGDSFQKDILCFTHKGGGRTVYSCSAPN